MICIPTSLHFIKHLPTVQLFQHSVRISNVYHRSLKHSYAASFPERSPVKMLPYQCRLFGCAGYVSGYFP
jgi:hypothetical protein